MKIAFHFGINKYDTAFYGTGNNLRMCVADAQVMQSISKANNFDEITLITDKAATKQLWLNTMANLAGKLKRGDTLFLTQSSHGTYEDLPNSKRSTAICLHDDILWDFEVRDMLKKFASGVLIVWMTDCCFSESNWRLVKLKKSAKPRFLKLTKPPEIMPTNGDKRQIKATLLTYSSSNIFQVSYEDEKGGAYTQAIHEALSKEVLTYYQLHKRASLIIAAHYPQSPILETVKPGDIMGDIFLTHDKPE